MQLLPCKTREGELHNCFGHGKKEEEKQLHKLNFASSNQSFSGQIDLGCEIRKDEMNWGLREETGNWHADITSVLTW